MKYGLAAGTRPRLLFVCRDFLFPTMGGGKIRTANILRQMKGGRFEIWLAAPVPAGWEAFSADIESVCDQFLPWPMRPPRRDARPFRPAGIAHLVAIHRAVTVQSADKCRSAAGAAVVAKALALEPDVVVVDFPYPDVLMPRRIGPASVLFTHNVEAEVFERQADLATGFWHQVALCQARRMARFERKVLRRYNSVIAVSSRDAAALRQRYSLPVLEPIATGVDLDFFRYSPPSTAPACGSDGGTIVFTGQMDWSANIDGVNFLMNEIWPRIAQARPQARALIVGHSPRQSLLAEVERRGLPWKVTGRVEDIRPYVASGHVSVIPLRVGSGTRIKAFEAMAMGRPVVSTRLGIEGLDMEDGRHYLAADTAVDFAAAILSLLADDARRESLARAARTRLEERFSWAHVARQFEAACSRAIAAKG